jgi:hypothetical protein
MADKVCMYCREKIGTVAGSITSHGVCKSKKCQDQLRRDMR